MSWLCLVILALGCAGTRGRLAPELASRTYYKPYDKVWEAVTGVILDELGCVERTLKKNKGYLETEWVHSIDTEGQHRWKIETQLEQREEAVLVQLKKTIQLKDAVSRTLPRYKQQKKDEPTGPNAGWSNEEAKAGDIEGLYRRIELRLGE